MGADVVTCSVYSRQFCVVYNSFRVQSRLSRCQIPRTDLSPWCLSTRPISRVLRLGPAALWAGVFPGSGYPAPCIVRCRAAPHGMSEAPPTLGLQNQNVPRCRHRVSPDAAADGSSLRTTYLLVRIFLFFRVSPLRERRAPHGAVPRP